MSADPVPAIKGGKEQHTPGPWKLLPGLGGGISGIIEGDGVAVASVCNYRPQETLANASRIVACVNACEGISTEDLEENRHPGAAESERDRLRAINVELLAALEAYRDDHDIGAQSANALRYPGVEPRFSQCQCDYCKQACAAISKAQP